MVRDCWAGYEYVIVLGKIPCAPRPIARKFQNGDLQLGCCDLTRRFDAGNLTGEYKELVRFCGFILDLLKQKRES
ncbi:hypothetical protein VNO77_21705 [Canavalia gladiata]|uniref:Uncharacterized protein n=1 Tax=Canavalia gladiata TaxID=3824 RepID=A0AAN9Q9T9_CANGL